MKLMYGIALAATAGFAGVCPFCRPDAHAATDGGAAAATIVAESDAPRVAEFARVTLHVEGMTCGGCALAARTVLQRLEGVEKAEVSYEKKTAVVTYDSARVTPEQMISALKEKLGYEATIRRESAG